MRSQERESGSVFLASEKPFDCEYLENRKSQRNIDSTVAIQGDLHKAKYIAFLSIFQHRQL